MRNGWNYEYIPGNLKSEQNSAVKLVKSLQTVFNALEQGYLTDKTIFVHENAIKYWDNTPGVCWG